MAGLEMNKDGKENSDFSQLNLTDPKDIDMDAGVESLPDSNALYNTLIDKIKKSPAERLSPNYLPGIDNAHYSVQYMDKKGDKKGLRSFVMISIRPGGSEISRGKTKHRLVNDSRREIIKPVGIMHKISNDGNRTYLGDMSGTVLSEADAIRKIKRIDKLVNKIFSKIDKSSVTYPD